MCSKMIKNDFGENTLYTLNVYVLGKCTEHIFNVGVLRKCSEHYRKYQALSEYKRNSATETVTLIARISDPNCPANPDFIASLRVYGNTQN